MRRYCMLGLKRMAYFLVWNGVFDERVLLVEGKVCRVCRVCRVQSAKCREHSCCSVGVLEVLVIVGMHELLQLS